MPEWVKYPVAVLLVAAVTAGLLAIHRLLPLFHYPIYYVITLLAIAYWLGTGPAILASILEFLALDFFLSRPGYVFHPLPSTPDDWAQFSAFLAGVSMVTIIMISLNKYRQRNEDLTQILQESKKRYQGLVEATSDWTWEVDAKGVYTYASPRVREMLGYEPHEVIGKTPFDLMLPDEVERLKPIVMQHFTNAEPIESLENINLHKDGHRVVLETSGLPVFNEDGSLAGYRGIDRDITQRKQAEEALYEVSQRLKFHVENSPLAVVEFDPRYRIILWTKGAERMFGWSAEEVLGKSAWEMKWIYEEDTDTVATLSSKLFDQRTAGNIIKNRNYRKNGSLIYCEWYNSTLFDSSGDVVSILSLVQDVTQETNLRKELENQFTLLQQALVPAAPETVSGYTTAAVYVPASAGQEIGGDFYDSFQTEDGKLGVVIGDVCGKGIEAASLAAASRSTFRAFTYELSSTAESMTHTNTVICAQQAETGKFVTVAGFVIDPESGHLDYTSAGHPPCAIRRANGQVEFISISNPPIGTQDKWGYKSTEDQLEPGDKLLLYTDGILEARRGLDFFDIDGIRRTLLEQGDKPPDELANSLLQAAKDWAEGDLRDDVAIVVIERNE